jgi:hypothetical protein
MDFPKRIYAVGTTDDDIQVGSRFEALPGGLLEDGAEVAIYGLLRVKRVQVTRKLVAAAGEPEGEGENNAQPTEYQAALDRLAAGAGE